MLDPGRNDQLEAHLDASCGAEANTGRRNRSGILIKYGNSPVFATSCIQKLVALSSAKAEHLATSDAGCNILWLRNVLNDMSINQKCTPIQQDNTGEIE